MVPNDLPIDILACFSPGNDNRKTIEDFLLHNYGTKYFLSDKSSDAVKFETPLSGPVFP